MAKKRKTKKDTSITEWYKIEIEDWEVSYYFGLNIAPKDLIQGAYWESSKLFLIGRIIQPVLEKASKARIEIAGDPQMDDHWHSKPTIVSARAIGWMEIPREDDKLIFYCSVPSRSLPNITVAVQSGKIKYASMFGTILKRRQGTISSLSLSMHVEDE
ncbi:MAG: hypothetical protein ACLP9S_04680 [Syntrophales bacterium]